MDNQILYLKLEPGEFAEIEVDDICKGIFNNSTGFQTAYFRIAEKLGDSTFKYALRSGTSVHPCKAMHFVAYGNFTYKFPQRGFKPAPDVDAIMALTSSQMDAINTALAQQIEQNRQLKAQLANQPTEVVTEQVTVNQIAPAPQSVFFQIGSAVLPTNSTVNLQQIADLVKDNPGLKLKVTGYADSDTGSAAWNKQLSEDRANNVANELVKLGVNKNNLIISGMGGVNTLTPPAFNRRVIIEAQ